MGRIRDLSAPGQTRRNEWRQRRQERGTPLRSTSVSDGQTRFIGTVSILVEGSGVVTGLWDVDGELRVGGMLNGDGTFTWTGPVNLQGLTTIGGTLVVNGTAFVVTSPSVDMGASIVFVKDLTVYDNTVVQDALTVGARTTLNGDLYTNLPLKAGAAANVHRDSAGKLWRTT